jgi:hypothetical protein
MKPSRVELLRRTVLIAASVLGASVIISAQQRLPIEPFRQFGSSVTPAFEGWYDNPDGSHNFLVGYLNRNTQQALDVPIGPNNRIEPGGPDLGQPTHFLPGRQYGMFVITVPKEFTRDQRLTWTIVANGQTMSIPLKLNPDYVVSPFHDVAVNNTPPILRFLEQGPTMQGPIAQVSRATSLSTSLATPLPLNVWAADDEKYSSGNNAPQRKPPPPVTLVWSKYRGTGDVKFEKVSPLFEKLPGGGASFHGKSTTTATFSQAGEFMLHLTANDYSGEGGGGEVCCWTTAIVKVTVKP